MEQKALLTMRVKYTCGCGFQSQSEAQAVHHATDRAHTITVNGVIRPAQPKAQSFVKERNY